RARAQLHRQRPLGTVSREGGWARAHAPFLRSRHPIRRLGSAVRNTRKEGNEMVPSLRRRIARPRWIVPAAAAVMLGTSGVAFAYVTGAGSGSGGATAGTMQTVTVSAFVGGDAPSSKLYPGRPAADVILRVNNPNSFTVQ